MSKEEILVGDRKDNPYFTITAALSTMAIGFALLFAVVPFLCSCVSPPSDTYQVVINVSERQVASSAFIKQFYIITPENKWYFTFGYNDTFYSIRPGHSYEVLIRKGKNSGEQIVGVIREVV